MRPVMDDFPADVPFQDRSEAAPGTRAEPAQHARQVAIAPRWTVRNAAGEALPPRLLGLLASVQALGSVLGASRTVGLSYRQALALVRRGEAVMDAALLRRTRRQGSELTPLAAKLVWAQQRFDARLGELLPRLEAQVGEELGWAASSAQDRRERDPTTLAPGAAGEARDADDDMARTDTEPADHALAPLLSRRSVSPKRLRAPAPGAADLDLMLQAALRAPDHGGLHPWRVIEFREAQRLALADCFEEEKRRRDPLASPLDLRRAREHALRSPALLAFVVSPRARSKVPLREQWLAAGAALGNLLNAAHQLGFGAIVLSGERCYDDGLMRQLGLGPDECLAGFVSLGTVAEAPPSARHALPGQVWSGWTPGLPPQR